MWVVLRNFSARDKGQHTGDNFPKTKRWGGAPPKELMKTLMVVQIADAGAVKRARKRINPQPERRPETLPARKKEIEQAAAT